MHLSLSLSRLIDGFYPKRVRALKPPENKISLLLSRSRVWSNEPLGCESQSHWVAAKSLRRTGRVQHRQHIRTGRRRSRKFPDREHEVGLCPRLITLVLLVFDPATMASWGA